MTTTRLVEALAGMADEAGSYATADSVLAAAGRRRRRTTAVAAAAVLAVSLGSVTAAVVASPDGEPAPPPPTATGAVPEMWTSCLVDAERTVRAETLPRLADDFSPVAVVKCTQESKRRTDGGTDLVEVERRGDDVAALVAALRLPDLTEIDPNVMCALRLVSVPWFALLDADGRWVRPGPPTTRCGGPRKEVTDAVDALKLRHVSSTPVGTIESAAAVAAGCGQHGKNEIGIEAPPRGFAQAGRGADIAATEVRLCVYRVRADLPDNGEFERGGLLPPARRAAIGQELRTAGPATACTKRASRFAVLSASKTYPVNVELDGCQRILVRPDGPRTVLAQASPTLIRLLDNP